MAPWDYDHAVEDPEDFVDSGNSIFRRVRSILSLRNMFIMLGLATLYIVLVTGFALFFSSDSFSKRNKKPRKSRAMFNDKREKLGMSTVSERRKQRLGKAA